MCRITAIHGRWTNISSEHFTCGVQWRPCKCRVVWINVCTNSVVRLNRGRLPGQRVSFENRHLPRRAVELMLKDICTEVQTRCSRHRHLFVDAIVFFPSSLRILKRGSFGCVDNDAEGEIRGELASWINLDRRIQEQ